MPKPAKPARRSKTAAPPRDGKPRRLKLEDATVAALRRATSRLRRDEKTGSPFAAAVTSALAKAKVGVKVRSRGGKLTLSGVDVDNVGRVGEALAKSAS